MAEDKSNNEIKEVTSINKPQLNQEQLLNLLSSLKKQKPVSKTRQYITNAISYTTKFMQSSVKYIDSFIKYVINNKAGDPNDIMQVARGPILFGMWIMIFFVGIGGIWSVLAPLDSAAVAIGSVIPSSKRKTLQHPSGGIIKNIYVSLGDEVKEGDKIVELDEVQLRSVYETSLNEYRVAEANEDRLTAERDLLDDIIYDDFIVKDSHLSEVQKIMSTQKEYFQSRRETYNKNIEALLQRHEQNQKQLEIVESQKKTLNKNLEIAKQGYRSTKELHQKGFVNKAQLLKAEGELANAEGSYNEIEAKISQTKQQISASEAEIASKKSERFERIMHELSEYQKQRNQAREKYLAAKDSLDRAIIRAPVDGTVIEINTSTLGGVISGGHVIAEIVPKNDKLIIEAKVPSKYIDNVKVGLKAKIRFSAFKSRTTPVFNGTVTSLSPDIIQDRQQQPDRDGPYYLAKIEIDFDDFNKVSKKYDLKLVSGMQAEVQIVTGTRTLMQYLLAPVMDNMFRAFIEK